MEQHSCFVGIAECGHIQAASVDTPERRKENAREVAKWIRSGLRIEKMTSAEVRAGNWCDCKSRKK